MKKIEDVLSFVEKSEDLKKQFAEAVKNKNVVAFFKSQGCDVTEEDVNKFISAKKATLSDSELDKVSGGSCSYVIRTVLDSVLATPCIGFSIADKVQSTTCDPGSHKEFF